MGFSHFISYLDIRRPLVFLCGPAYDENNPSDRRLILRGYINSKWNRSEKDKKDYINAFPIIVDNFFKPDEIRSEGLNIRINVIEEIISNIAYKTYIFLDTMSTSYELGQFTNFAYNSENVSVFIDKQYKNRISNSIGNYIKESFQKNFVEYSAAYDSRGNIFFPFKKESKHRIPKEIIDALEKDNPANINVNLLYPISFSTDSQCVNNPGTIVCEKREHELLFDFSIKNLFYFVSATYRNIKETKSQLLKEMPKSIFDESFVAFLEELKKELLASFVCCSKSKNGRSFVLASDFSLTIKVGNMDSSELIYHMLYISFMLANYGGKQIYAVSKYDSLFYGASFASSEIDYLDIKSNHIKKLLNKYKKQSIDLGTVEKTLIIRGKKRNIVAYKDNYSGKELKYLHKEILNSFLFVLPSSDASFAYKEKTNAKMCLEAHKGNTYFIKYDINKYFESISIFRVIKKISNYIISQFHKRFNKITYFYKIKNRIEKDVVELIYLLFYKYKLPIGFMPSPKISDFYLYDLDEEMKKIDGVIYTRYADDILLSSNSKESLSIAKEKLNSLLKQEGLSINNKKVRVGSLINNNDSFRFLGINLVKRDSNSFEVTISKRYLTETSKMFCFLASNQYNNDEYEKLAGRINYIKSVSHKSFEKLKNIIKIKLKAKKRPSHKLAYLLID